MPHYYVTPAGAAALRSYRYIGADHSLLYRYLLSPFADWVVARLIPLWVAPNLITLLGMLLQVAAFLVLVAYCPTLREAPPAWAGLLAAAALFGYATLDNCDGKQARRTGSSSPLGLMFDHGLDAVNGGFFGPLIMAQVLGASAGGWRHFALWAVAVGPFFANTWEENWTGEFHLPIINGPNEGIIIICASYAATSLVLPAGWWGVPCAPGGSCEAMAVAAAPVTRALAALAGERAAQAPGTRAPGTPLDLMIAYGLIGAALTMGANCLRVARAVGRDAPRQLEAFSQLATFAALPAAAGAWLAVPATRALVAQLPYHWYAALGAAFVLVTSKLMLSHTSRQAYAPPLIGLALILAPPMLAAARDAGTLSGFAPEIRGGPIVHRGGHIHDPLLHPALWAAVVFNVCSALHFAAHAPWEVAEELGIKVFSITKLKKGA